MKVWTQEEIDYALASELDVEELAEKLDRTVTSVKSMLSRRRHRPTRVCTTCHRLGIHIRSDESELLRLTRKATQLRDGPEQDLLLNIEKVRADRNLRRDMLNQHQQDEH